MIVKEEDPGRFVGYHERPNYLPGDGASAAGPQAALVGVPGPEENKVTADQRCKLEIVRLVPHSLRSAAAMCAQAARCTSARV
jgi:hypothetical protein